MVRYRRFRKRRSTVNKQSFQWFADISTSATSMQIITVSAGGESVKKRLKPFFEAYKYYKMGNVSVKLVPASVLPVDPTGLSYETGENTVDPRDQLSPGLTRITNGEDIFEDLTGVSLTRQHAIYNQMMLDRRWFKWTLQSGLKRWAKPRYWQIGQLHQDMYPGATINVPLYTTSSPNDVVGTGIRHQGIADGTYKAGHNSYKSDPHSIFQTGHKGVLGWLPTDSLVDGVSTSDISYKNTPLTNPVPEIEVYKIILPPAYKTRYYYRMFVTETIYFREPVNNFLEADDSGNTYSSLDRFVRPAPTWLTNLPSSPNVVGAPEPNPNNDGGTT